MRQPRVDKAALFETLDYRPHAGQQLVHNSRAPRRILACGVRFGKSLCGAMECCAALMEPRDQALGWVVAPSYDTAARIFQRVVVTFETRMRHRVKLLDERERRLVIVNLAGGLSELRAKSADRPESLLGEGLDFLIVDEAAQLDRAIWQQYLSQRLIDRHGWRSWSARRTARTTSGSCSCAARSAATRRTRAGARRRGPTRC